MRVLWLAEEIGLPYNTEILQMFSSAMQHADYLAIHPMGKVPAIDDNGFILWETTAIFDYLISKYSDGGLIPPRDTALGAKAVQWINFAENPLTIIMGEIVAHDGVLPPDRCIPALVERGRELAPDLIAIVEKALQGDKSGAPAFIIGDNFSAADIMLGFALNIAQYLGFVSESTPNTLAYCQRLTERPAFQRASQQ
jgi:glutathione S-transferase